MPPPGALPTTATNETINEHSARCPRLGCGLIHSPNCDVNAETVLHQPKEMAMKAPSSARAQGGPKARRSWQARLALLFGVVAGSFLGLFVAGIATGQLLTTPDTVVADLAAFGACIAIPAVLAVVFSALAARARKQSATGSVAQQDPSRPRNGSGTPER